MCAIEFVSATRTEIAETLEKVEFFFQCEISGAADDRFSFVSNLFRLRSNRHSFGFFSLTAPLKSVLIDPARILESAT